MGWVGLGVDWCVVSSECERMLRGRCVYVWTYLDDVVDVMSRVRLCVCGG